MPDFRIAGRSSSHFTRVVRIVAHELGIPYRFQVVRDLLEASSDDYLGNPALRIPVLEAEDGAWFGALNICRALSARAPAAEPIVWPEQLQGRLAANAQELVLQGMATEVGLIMRKLARPTEGDRYQTKGQRSLIGSLAWLDAHLPQILPALPEPRRVSFLEVTTFCFVTHLEFRQIADTSSYATLQSFCRSFGERQSGLQGDGTPETSRRRVRGPS